MDNKYFITGFKELDDQHEKVFSLISSVKQAINYNEPKKKIVSLINELDFYATEHFAFEEKFAEKCNFLRLSDLKESHNDFKNHYFMIKKYYMPKFNSTSLIYALHMASVLELWLEFHFEYVELELVKELRTCFKDGLH